VSLEEIKFAFTVLQALATLAIGIWLYLEKKRDTTHARIEALENKVDTRLDDHATQLATLQARPCKRDSHFEDIGRRLSGLEGRTGPTHKDMGELHEKVNEIAVTSGRMEGEIKGISDVMHLILNRITEKGMP
jgi:Tfp pilus assembly protein PilO